MVTVTDTICAIATPSGRGGVGVIRISGPNAYQIAINITRTKLRPRFAHFSNFYKYDTFDIVDQGIALFFKGPKSFTGEDVVELQGHGGAIIMDLLLETVLQNGARLAEPGEFSKRAFLNNKLDLTQAEAIADLIDAGSRAAAASAMRSLQGEFSNAVNKLLEKLIYLRMYVESAIDFPEEEIDFLNDGNIEKILDEIEIQFHYLQTTAKQGALLRDGIQVVLAGLPNAGKSSLLNALSKQQSAIVTDIAGTTRDIIRERIDIAGIPVHIADTAGLRDNVDMVEREGVARAQTAISQADLVLLVIDSSLPTAIMQSRALLEKLNINNVIVVFNKSDLSTTTEEIDWPAHVVLVTISAKTGDGLLSLQQAMLKMVSGGEDGQCDFIARRRHLDALARAFAALMQAKQRLLIDNAGELVAEELKIAQNELSKITGAFSADDLLGEIFSNFCIGK